MSWKHWEIVTELVRKKNISPDAGCVGCRYRGGGRRPCGRGISEVQRAGGMDQFPTDVVYKRFAARLPAALGPQQTESHLQAHQAHSLLKFFLASFSS